MKITNSSINVTLDYYMGKLETFVSYIETDPYYDGYQDIRDLFEIGFNSEPDELVERLENKDRLVRKYRELLRASIRNESFDKEIFICKLKEMEFAIDGARPTQKEFVFGFGRK